MIRVRTPKRIFTQAEIFSRNPSRNVDRLFKTTVVICVMLILLAPQVMADDTKWYTVTKVISGDQMQLDTGSVIQYGSISAPSLTSESERVQEFAKQSTQVNKQLIEGKRIRVEWGPRLKAKNGNYTPYVFLEDGSMANLKMLESGYAKFSAEPPYSKYIDQFRETARLARFRGEGLWIHEDENKRRVVVVGNINTKRYYHPDESLLDDMPRPQLREFDSVTLANAEGYKPSYEYRGRNQQLTELY